jgi:hypothetical protein
MGKGDNQRSNREAKKPKADKKIEKPSSTFIKPTDARKPSAKPPAK